MSEQCTVKVINRSPYPLPKSETEYAAGVDLRAAISAPCTLAPLARDLISTGLFIELPPGYEAQIRPRSGLAARHGVTLLNSPGTIDADYRGELKVILINLSNAPATIQPGERIAQLVIGRSFSPCWEEVDQLTATQRGAGGFGSTGQH